MKLVNKAIILPIAAGFILQTSSTEASLLRGGVASPKLGKGPVEIDNGQRKLGKNKDKSAPVAAPVADPTMAPVPAPTMVVDEPAVVLVDAPVPAPTMVVEEPAVDAPWGGLVNKKNCNYKRYTMCAALAKGQCWWDPDDVKSANNNYCNESLYWDANGDSIREHCPKGCAICDNLNLPQ